VIFDFGQRIIGNTHASALAKNVFYRLRESSIIVTRPLEVRLVHHLCLLGGEQGDNLGGDLVQPITEWHLTVVEFYCGLHLVPNKGGVAVPQVETGSTVVHISPRFFQLLAH
jgi:hypothetical protein